MASAGREAAVPADLGGESSLVSRPSWLPSKGSTPPAPRGRGQDKDAKLRKSCNCRNSRCLKLYCECFASGQYCFGCNCQACHNNPENDEMRKRAIEQAPSPPAPRPPRLAHAHAHIPASHAHPSRTPAAATGCCQNTEQGIHHATDRTPDSTHHGTADARAQPLGLPTQDQPFGARRREQRRGRPAQQGLPLQEVGLPQEVLRVLPGAPPLGPHV